LRLVFGSPLRITRPMPHGPKLGRQSASKASSPHSEQSPIISDNMRTTTNVPMSAWGSRPGVLARARKAHPTQKDSPQAFCYTHGECRQGAWLPRSLASDGAWVHFLAGLCLGCRGHDSHAWLALGPSVALDCTVTSKYVLYSLNRKCQGPRHATDPPTTLV